MDAEPHDIRCHATDGCINLDDWQEKDCNKCENNHCQCTSCEGKRNV